MIPLRSRLSRCWIYFVNDHWAQFVKFAGIGFLTFGINFLAFHIFFSVLRLDYRLAVTFAYMITVISHFLLHRYFTFGASEQKIERNLFKYAVMLTLNYVIIISVVWLVTDVMKGSPYIGLILSTAVTASFSFFFMKYFVFGSPAVKYGGQDKA